MAAARRALGGPLTSSLACLLACLLVVGRSIASRAFARACTHTHVHCRQPTAAIAVVVVVAVIEPLPLPPVAPPTQPHWWLRSASLTPDVPDAPDECERVLVRAGWRATRADDLEYSTNTIRAAQHAAVARACFPTRESCLYSRTRARAHSVCGSANRHARSLARLAVRRAPPTHTHTRKSWVRTCCCCALAHALARNHHAQPEVLLWDCVCARAYSQANAAAFVAPLPTTAAAAAAAAAVAARPSTTTRI